MSKRKQDEKMHDDGTYVVKKSRKGNIVAFVLCALIAMIIWLYATNDEKKEAEAQTPSTAEIVAQAWEDVA
jgi:lysophospholipase L1-like esterase